MADRRYIAQEITDSGQVEQVARGAMDVFDDRAVAFIATTFWAWLIAHIDDDGRVIGKPDALRSKIFARYMDLVSVEELAEVVAWMNDVELLVWYEVAGSPRERYLYSPRFATHQTLRTDRYSASRHPAPPAWSPEDGHPYAKNPELRKAKPQRDSRRTVRVPRRPANKAEAARSAPAGQPDGNRSAPAGEPIADGSAPIGDEASPHPTSPRLSSPRLSAGPAGSPARVADAAALPRAAGSLEAIGDRQVRELLEAAEGRWRDALQALLIAGVTNANLVTWFSNTTLEERGGFAIVWAPNVFAVEWLTKHYRAQVAKVLALPTSRVLFVVEGTTVELEPEPVDEEAS